VVELPAQEVAVEERCVVRFVDRDAPNDALPVAWMWRDGEGLAVVQKCQVEYPDGPHK
jgi:hypothetical protein